MSVSVQGIFSWVLEQLITSFFSFSFNINLTVLPPPLPPSSRSLLWWGTISEKSASLAHRSPNLLVSDGCDFTGPVLQHNGGVREIRLQRSYQFSNSQLSDCTKFKEHIFLDHHLIISPKPLRKTSLPLPFCQGLTYYSEYSSKKIPTFLSFPAMVLNLSSAWPASLLNQH